MSFHRLLGEVILLKVDKEGSGMPWQDGRGRAKAQLLEPMESLGLFTARHQEHRATGRE